MIKPDAVERGLTEKIEAKIKEAGLKTVQSRLIHLTIEDAQNLYSVHKGKNFYDGLIKFIISGPVFLMQLEAEDAIHKLRALMGDTDPRKAAPGTIRADFKEENIFTADGSIKNIIHGSDSLKNAEYESSLFF
ncbi:MAG: nucleoside-diphosphate kinase [Candidatus Margulisiibacteriota bacterium]|jgi:nucleoside-diphosphate kinase